MGEEELVKGGQETADDNGGQSRCRGKARRIQEAEVGNLIIPRYAGSHCGSLESAGAKNVSRRSMLNFVVRSSLGGAGESGVSSGLLRLNLVRPYPRYCKPWLGTIKAVLLAQV